MTQESKKIFYTFLLDKAAPQVIDCWTLHCTAVTVLLIFIKRSECSSLNTCGKFWLRLNPRAEQCDQWRSKPQSLTPVEFTHAWVLLAVPQTADCSTETKKKLPAKISLLQTPFPSIQVTFSHFCPACWLSPSGAPINLTLLTFFAYPQALFLHQITRPTLFSNMTFLGDQDNKKVSLTA